MPYVLVEDFKGGIDTRRTVVTSVPGTAVTLTNAHVTRGGEIEKRRAFKLWATLPANTHGLAAGGGRVFVFGSDNITLASSLPVNLNYIRFQHANGSTAMAEILGHDFFEGRVYASAQFTDGIIYHYWDEYVDSGTTPNNRIDDWLEGRARSSWSITGGNATSSTGTAAQGAFYVTAGTSTPGNNLLNLRVNNVDILTGPIAHTGSNTTTGIAIAAAINSLTSTPNYTATESSGTVFVNATTKGTSQNGLEVSFGVEGDFTGSAGNMANGEDNAITNITVDGASIIENPILWETSHTYTAEKVADEINSTFTDPEWEATSIGAQVNIIARESGTALNSKTVDVIETGDLTHGTLSATAGGLAMSTSPLSHVPGGFVRAFDNQMHSLSDDRWHNSHIGDPTWWQSTGSDLGGSLGTDRSGFRVLSNHSRGAEELVAIAPYFDNLAVFGQDVIQIWNVDEDPDAYSRSQILNNTGTISGRSVVEIGDSDVFYLSRSGIRSLKARDSSNSAYIGDIGNPIDTIIIDAIAEDIQVARKATGVVDPRDGRYLLAIGEKVYVFSYFPSSKISAWSVYEPGFTIDHWAFDGTELLCRSGDNIYSLGGEFNNEYDSTEVTVQLPFLDAGKPATNKMWTGFDAVCSSDWDISIGTDPTDITQYEAAATINKATYGMGRVSLSSTSTHLALRMVNSRAGAATLGNCAVHYELNEAG